MKRFSYTVRSLNRTLLTAEGALLPELLERSAPDGLLPRSRFGEFERLAGGVLLPALKRADTRLNERIASFTPEEEDFLVVLEQMHASDFARATIAAAKAESRSPLAAAGLPDNVQDQS